MDLSKTKRVKELLAQAEPFLRLNQSQPVPRPHRNPHAELATWQLQSLTLQSGKPLSTSKFMLSSSDAHTCKTPFEELKPMKLRETEVPKIHLGRYLVCKVVGKPIARIGVHTLIQDLNGDVEEIGLYNFSSNLDDVDWIAVGTIFVIKEPWLQYSRTKLPSLRVDSPSDVIFVDPSDEMFMDKIGAKKWFESMSKNAEVWRKQANEYFKNGKYEKALFLYNRGLRCDPELAVLYLNKSLAYLKTGAYYDAYESAKIGMEKGGDKEKALYRLGQAAYGMREWQTAAKHYLQVLIEFPQNTDASEQSKRATARIGEERYGKHNLKMMFVECKDGTKDDLDVADYMGPIQIANIPGKGRGIIALKDIQKGTLLVVSKPVSSAHSHDVPKRLLENGNITTNDPRCATQMLLVINTVQWLKKNPQKAKEVYDLYAGDNFKDEVPFGVLDVSRIEKICISNAFDTDKDEMDDVTAILTIPSYFNHSCLANARKQRYADVMVIHATTDIKKGEEICLAYISPMEEYSVRKKLFDNKNFTCNCKLCQIDSKDELCSKRYEIVKEFEEFAEKNPTSFKEVTEMGEPILKKIRETYAKRKEYKMVLAHVLNILYPMYYPIDPAKSVKYMEELMTLVDEHHVYVFDMPRVYYLIGPMYSYFGNPAKCQEMLDKAMKMSCCTDLEHLQMTYPVGLAP